MKTSKFIKVSVLLIFLVAWLGFIGPWAVSAESWILPAAWFGITGLGLLYAFMKRQSRFDQSKGAALLLAVLMGFGLSACSKVPAGNVGVKVYLLGGAKGVESEVLGTGRYWIGFNEELYLFPLFQQNHTWSGADAFSFQTKEGMVVSTDAGITYHIEREKVSKIYQSYRKPIEEIRDQVVRRQVQNALNAYGSKMPIEETYGLGKTRLFDSAQAYIYRELAPYGIIIDKLFIVNEFRLPRKVVDALNSKIEATQDAEKLENKLRGDSAVARSKIILAKADAEAIRLKAQEITQTMVEYEKAKKWNGVLPTHQLSGNTFLNIK